MLGKCRTARSSCHHSTSGPRDRGIAFMGSVSRFSCSSCSEEGLISNRGMMIAAVPRGRPIVRKRAATTRTCS